MEIFREQEKKYFDPLTRSEIRNIVLDMLEAGTLQSGPPSPNRSFPEYIVKEDGQKYSGISTVLDGWRRMLRILEFSPGGSSTAGWEEFTITGRKGAGQSESAIAKGYFIYSYDWVNHFASHSISFTYRKEDGSFFAYNGNVEHIWDQVLSVAKIMSNRVRSNQFGIGDKAA